MFYQENGVKVVVYVCCLQYIPMSVLYGVFLFMGVSSVKGIQVQCDVIILWSERLGLNKG